ncbi:MAG: rhodanese-like domain-containing protein [Candidatus Didemnitutus sp.]|nr:rhodanese-like domain-containing protein [Candidatus Didemnitutus sp.]
MRKRLLILFVLAATAALGSEAARISPVDAAAMVFKGDAVLVDVREASEWTSTGVAAPALLLAKSDFDRAQIVWAPFLADFDKSKTLILYCRSGRRSGLLAATLAARGYKALNGGGLAGWERAGLPVRKVAPASK